MEVPVKSCSDFIVLGLALLLLAGGPACGDDGEGGEAGGGGTSAGAGGAGSTGSAGTAGGSGSNGASCGDADSCTVDDDCPWPVQCMCNPCGQSFGPARKCLDGCCLDLEACCDYACGQ